MGDILKSPTNGRCVVFIPRSGSHSLALTALVTWFPDKHSEYLAAVATGETWHPAAFIPAPINADEVAMVVRNPVERFRSMCSHRPDRSIDEHLNSPCYGPLPPGPFARLFRFEDQLNACAEWLGLPVPLPQEDATEEANKPTLSEEQLTRVREIFADDIALWESLA